MTPLVMDGVQVDERNGWCDTAGTNPLVGLTTATTVHLVRPFRLLKISLVVAAFALLSAAAARDPGALHVPLPRIVEELIEQLIDQAIDPVE
jgi:hypothetical protein